MNERKGDSATVELTMRAAEKVKGLLEHEGRPEAALRLAVTSGGCSGLRYELRFEDERRESDHEWTQHGVLVVVDPKSAPHLAGCRIDYLDDLNESGFRIENPNAASTCGCGESFGR